MSPAAKRQLYPNFIGGAPGGDLIVPAPLWDYDPGDVANRGVGAEPTPLFFLVNNRTAAAVKTNDFVQTVMADKPELDTAVFGTVDGMRTIQDSTNLMLSTGNGGAPGPSFPPEMTVFMRFKYTAGSTAVTTILLRMTFTDWITAAGVSWSISVNSFNRITSFMFNLMTFVSFDNISNDPPNNLVLGSTNLLVIRYSRINNLHDMRLNGVVQPLTNIVSSTALTTPRISVFNWGNINLSTFAGDVSHGDFRGYRAFLNQAQIDEVSTEINNNV